LLQVRNSRFISHEQLFEFMQYRGIDHSRSSFNWRTRRLIGSGYLSVCERRSGTGSPVYRITKEGLALLEHSASLRPYCIPGPSTFRTLPSSFMPSNSIAFNWD